MPDAIIVPIKKLGIAHMDAQRTNLLCDYCPNGKAEVIHVIDVDDEEWHTICGPCADVRIAHLNHYSATGVAYPADDYIVEDMTFLIADLRDKLLKGDRLTYGRLESWLGRDGMEAILNFDGSWEPPDGFDPTNR